MIWDDRTPEKRLWQPLGGPQRKPTISDYTDLTQFWHKWWISTWRQPLQPWRSAESRTHRWAPETDLQWGLCHLDSHRERPLEPVDHLHSDFAAVGTNYWFVWPEGNIIQAHIIKFLTVKKETPSKLAVKIHVIFNIPVIFSPAQGGL